MLESANTLSCSTPERSQNGCLVGKTSGISPNFLDQTDKHDVRKSLSDLTHPARMSSWIDSVLAAEATKAGSAIRLIPRTGCWRPWGVCHEALKKTLVRAQLDCHSTLKDEWLLLHSRLQTSLKWPDQAFTLDFSCLGKIVLGSLGRCHYDHCREKIRRFTTDARLWRLPSFWRVQDCTTPVEEFQPVGN